MVCQATIAELLRFGRLVRGHVADIQGVVEEESACRQALEQMLNQPGRVRGESETFDSLPEFVGPYRVLEPIAAGGMGTVLRARTPSSNGPWPSSCCRCSNGPAPSPWPASNGKWK